MMPRKPLANLTGSMRIEGGATMVGMWPAQTVPVAVSSADQEILRDLLEADGVPTRVVSLPSWYLFSRQDREYRDQLFGWYDEDSGQSTIREILDLIEGAGPGRPCLGNT